MGWNIMRLNFDTKYLFASASDNDKSKTIFDNYSLRDILFVQEEHINYMLPWHIERCELRNVGGVISSVPCEECSSYHKCNALKDFKDNLCIPIYAAIIKNPKTNDIDIVSLNAVDFRLYSIYRWEKSDSVTINNDNEMSKRIDSFLKYGDSL